MNKLILLIIGFLFIASSLNDARKANEAFKNGDYELAVELYRQAIDQNPDNSRLYFNLGNALAKAGYTEEAMKVYEQFRNMTEEINQQALADYNKGKLLSEQENFDEAISHFREALRKNPDDEDARFNYELAQRLKQQQEQQQQDQQQDSKSDQDDSEGEDDQENDENQDENQQQDPNQKPQNQDQSQQDQEQLPKPTNMSEQEAENILDALEQIERELLENREKEANVRRQQNDKDW
ncbi:tetratricopeptide repeat protein [Rhodohalobacter sp.]|uniref:tetratricopeptide repeat protein n=1 Tax=Rhodohalobacter sp. TaxID=1974210 RepID=UPI002ACDD7A0|nr:tetratricopeptide repeat protein [Rhodohalobacter sp.]MDZ7755688.1 tetratricopeptide repeat protein [Rhodohalobacter sp.]